MNSRDMLEEISKALKIDAKDAPKTLMRFRKEIAEMKGEMGRQ